MKSNLNKIPQVGRLLESDTLKFLSLPRGILKFFIKNYLEKFRTNCVHITAVGTEEEINFNFEVEIKNFAEAQLSSGKKAINGTGIFLHTGLGRAPLSDIAIQSLIDGAGYNLVQSDRDGDSRALREELLENILKELTGAESSTIVNNNAAATFLILNAHCKGKEVIISRGQLVEIGGSYRIPDIIKQSGCILKEVGTTNKTHLKDYKNAITENTGAILFVHHSNFKISGFTSEPSIEELCQLGKQSDIPVIADLGSGALVNLEKWGLQKEITVRETIKAGIFACCYSGDKLIGGPQAGIISGTKDAIELIRKSDFSRMFRVCKLTLRSLEATLLQFLDEDSLQNTIPVYQFLSVKPEDLEIRGDNIISNLKNPKNLSLTKTESFLGGGSLPESALNSLALTYKFPRESDASNFAKKLRYAKPAIFSKLSNSTVFIDLRTINPLQDQVLLKILSTIS